ncbi:phosphinothricin acetyltransferase [Anaerovirgula multivorans]|uniref:Phosphinothricin acetyltransferase n=1 Tax=Anaerovirgula multivorans TaxID=312168 RepID=A0A239FXN2_9FIRM|nr:arsinothricin resistance N-acetyltransferase ArsN1 family A [Anaerovirgula multivorans]SNS61505.1 phosphinothricin acetyltransferase [Anaerovirgula multivorans]
MCYFTRIANIDDIPYITQIYNEGIEDKIATLETDSKTEKDMEAWLTNRSESHKVIVITDQRGKIYGWASLNTFNNRCCYSGVADFSIYIKRDMRGKGLGKLLLDALEKTAKKEGFHKLVLSAFDSNEAGKRLYKSRNFREVGTYIKQGLLDGQWVDITVMEKLLD